MMMLGSYEIIEKIADEYKKALYRVIDSANGDRLLIKVFQNDSRYTIDSFKLKNEFEILSSIHIPYCVHALRIENIDGYTALIMEDPGGMILSDYLRAQPSSLLQKLSLAIKITTALANLHAMEILHKDINPFNMFVLPNSEEIFFYEFGLAERLGKYRESSFFGIGTPEYISPEQTGRTSRTIDYRSDIYSLGITFYELFCNRLPFDTTDINGLFHAHMTQIPESPAVMVPEIPGALSDIIDKMICKEPDDRYNSCTGLLVDLNWVLGSLNRDRDLGIFELAKADVSTRFSMPVKPYGKARLFDGIEDTKYRVVNGENQFVVLEGVKGSGKTYILKELHKKWMDQVGMVILIDLTKEENSIPYHAVRQVFDKFIELVQSGSADKKRIFNERVSEALGSSVKLLVTVLPNLAKLIPSTPAEQLLEENDHKPLIDRLIVLLAEVIVAFDPPFVIMIDGLSGIDDESSLVFRNLIQHRNSRAPLVIGTAEPEMAFLPNFLQRIGNDESLCSFSVLNVPEYGYDDIQMIMRDAFNFTSRKATHLSRLIFNKTNGNPYYTMNFIKTCCEEGWIFFNPDFGVWDYRAIEIERDQITTNVAQRVLDKFNDLESFEIEILKTAAGTGFDFSLEILSAISNCDSAVITEVMTKSMEYGLIAGRFNPSESYDGIGSELPMFRFSHDSVYQNLLALTDEQNRMEISYAYGKLLMEKGSTTTEELGQLIHHMNHAIPLLKSVSEKREVALLNLEYSIRLKRIGVLDKSYKHTEIGLSLLENKKFEETDSLSFKLYLERAELAYLNLQFDEAEAYFDALIGNCVMPVNQAKAIRIKMILYVSQGKMTETIRLAEQALKVLGVSFDGSPTGIKVGRELLNFNMATIGKKIHDLEKLPVSTDSEVYMITQIYMTLISVSYLVGKNLFIYVILRILNLTLKHGLTVHSSYAFSIYGLIAGSALGNPVKGIGYGDLGIRLAERFGNTDMLAKCNFTYGFFLNHWVNHPSGNLPYLAKAIELSYQTGDMVFYSYSVAAYILTLIDAGTPLNGVQSSLELHFDSVQDKHVEDVFNLLVLMRQVIFTLKGETDSPYSLSAIDFDEKAFQEKLKSSSMQSIYAVYLVQKLKLLYLFEQYELAYEVCLKLQGDAAELMGLSVYPEYYQYYSLTLLELDLTKSGRIGIVNSNQRKLYRWMRYAPQNFRHRFLTVQGVLRMKRGKKEMAVKSLTEALQIAQKQGFVQDEALINELLGRCYEQTNQAMIRRMYIKNAYALFMEWGASTKGSQLKGRYGDIIFDEPDEAGYSSVQQVKQVDLFSVFKSAQTLSSETQPKELLKRLLTIISENAGSEKAIILMKHDILIPVAWSTPEGVTIMEEGNIEICDYPETIIHQAARNQEAVIVEDVSRIAVLKKDPYVACYNPVSMMSVPILWKNELFGILYLENNRMSGAFNKGRLEVMQVLTAQFVISYDNALLYESLRLSESELKTHKYELERVVEERTEELSRANFEIQMLLDHAGQGFFSFDRSGRIGNELSHECYRIFRKNISGDSVSELLGAYCRPDEADLISKIIDKSFKTTEAFESKVYLSLLPQELKIRDMTVSLEYQMVEDSDSRRVMTILTDVTETHALMLIHEEEKRNLKMIVRVIKNRNSFLRSLEDYEAFTKDGCRKLVEQKIDTRELLTELFRMVHTYKGDFAQWGFSKTESALHEIESLIAFQRTLDTSVEDIVEFIEELDFEKAIEKDLMILENAIGKSFVQGDEYYEISRAEIVSLEESAEALDSETLISRIKELRLVNLKELLIPYDDYIKTLAFELDKKVNPLQVVGEDLKIDRKYYHDLIKVLTHIFRNIMDYGIEEPEMRLRQSKSESGSITCRIRRTSDSTMALDLEDDGSGIDSQSLLKILLQRDAGKADYYLQLPREELMQLIFSDGVTTSGDITMLSGRGIGLSAVRSEVEKLNGTITVSSTLGVGTRFIINLPIIV